MTQEREAFEKAFTHYNLDGYWNDRLQEYEDGTAQVAWRYWQAAYRQGQVDALREAAEWFKEREHLCVIPDEELLIMAAELEGGG